MVWKIYFRQFFAKTNTSETSTWMKLVHLSHHHNQNNTIQNIVQWSALHVRCKRCMTHCNLSHILMDVIVIALMHYLRNWKHEMPIILFSQFMYHRLKSTISTIAKIVASAASLNIEWSFQWIYNRNVIEILDFLLKIYANW